MKLLDRYIIKNFLGTFFFMVLILSVIVLIIDLSSKLDRIKNNGSSTLEAITDFYPFWIVWIVSTFMPVAVFISVIYFSSRLAMKTEFVAMLAGGISISRLLKPYMIVAIGIFSFSLAINNFILPWANIKKNTYLYSYMQSEGRSRAYKSNQKISSEIQKDEFIFAQSYNRIQKKGSNFIYQKFDSLNHLKHQILARQFEWNKEDSSYVLIDFYEKYPNWNGTYDSLYNKAQINKQFSATPDDILPEEYVAETMNSIELAGFIENQKFKGSSSVNTYQNELYQRVTSPISTLILTLFGFSIATRKRRGGIGLNLALGLVLAFAYIFFGESSKVFSEKQIMSPFMASILPSICFGIVAMVLYYKRTKS